MNGYKINITIAPHQKMNNNSLYKILPAYAIIFLMIGAAMVFNNREIILPEVSALAIGCLVYQNPAWLARPFHLLLLPSLTAVGGFFINRLELNLAFKLVMVLALVVAVLILFKSTLAPAFATGLLPVITHADSMMFVYAILVLTLLLYMSIRLLHQHLPPAEPIKPPDHQHKLLYLSFVSGWIVTCWVMNWMFVAAIPPVIVVGYESIHKDAYPAGVFGKQALCLVAAALIGTLSLYLFKNLLLAALIDMVLVTVLISVVKFQLTPTYAMSLLPMVLPGTSHTYFGLWVLLMCLVVLGFVFAYKNVRMISSFLPIRSQ